MRSIELRAWSLVLQVFLVPFLWLFAACGHGHLVGGPCYFKEFTGQFIPIRPEGRISAEQAAKRKVYMVAYFDNKGRVVKCTKHLDGRQFGVVQYTYYQSGALATELVVNADGDTNYVEQDEGGKVVKREKRPHAGQP